MKEEVLYQQLENLFPDLESELLSLQSKLDTSFVEESEILESGFSFSSSLKDISRFICINLTEQLGNVNQVMYIINNWQKFINAINNNDLLPEEDLELFNVFINVYYDSIDYFKKQFLTHLGEKVEFESEYIQDQKVSNFVGDTGFRQRKFTYLLEHSGNNSVQQVTASTTRRYEIKQTEREKVEMLNSIFLRFILRPLEAESLCVATSQKFPELELELQNLLIESGLININNGDCFIEVSPPFENYSYQHDCMFRVFTFNGDSFEVVQYAIPYKEQEINIVLQNLATSFNAQVVNTSNSNEYLSNKILNNFYICSSNHSSTFLNSFPSIVDYGGGQVIEDAAQIINPKIDTIGNTIHPYIVEYLNSPGFMQTAAEHNKSTYKYKQIFLAAIATLDLNVHIDNPELTELLESGSLLDAVINGEDVNQLLMDSTNGEIFELAINANGYCDTVSGSIGESEFIDTLSFTEAEVARMQFKGKVMSLTKSGDVKLDLMKFVDNTGKEKKLFICPICKSQGNVNYVDICSQNCPNCNVGLNDLRLAAESSDLGGFIQNYSNKSEIPQAEGSGIFGILFDLFGAVVNLF